MGDRSFMLATRMPMSRDGFHEWLRTPLPGLDIIDNPAAMWTGWDPSGVLGPAVRKHVAGTNSAPR